MMYNYFLVYKIDTIVPKTNIFFKVSYDQIHINHLKAKGKTDKYNYEATKCIDGNLSLQLFPKKVATLLPKRNCLYFKLS